MSPGVSEVLTRNHCWCLVKIVVCVRWQGNLVAEFTVTPATGALPTLRPTDRRPMHPNDVRSPLQSRYPSSC